MAPFGTPFALYFKTNCVKDAERLARLKKNKKEREKKTERKPVWT